MGQIQFRWKPHNKTSHSLLLRFASKTFDALICWTLIRIPHYADAGVRVPIELTSQVEFRGAS